MSGADSAGPLDQGTIVISSVVIIGALMFILDATVINVALNTLAKTFDSPLAAIQ